MAQQFAGSRLLASLLHDDNGLEKYMKMALTRKMFYGPELELFDLIETHIDSFGVLPKSKTVKEIGTILASELEPPEYYREELRKRHIHREIVASLESCQEQLSDKNPDEALAIMSKAVSTLTIEKNKVGLIDFTSEGAGIIESEYLLQNSQEPPGVGTGWKTLDKMMNGLQAGDVMTIIGRPSAGKTYLMLYMAHNAWRLHKHRPVFVSMEMKSTALIQRIAAMHTKTPITRLRSGELLKKEHTEMTDLLELMPEKYDRFWIVDGNLTATANEIVMLCRQLNPDVLFVDGAYLLRSIGRNLQRWERIAETLEVLKHSVATELGIPVIASYQFNRRGAKEKALENIAGSDAIPQISSVVLGIELEEEKSIENLVKKKIEILKGRSGEVGEFYVNWKFDLHPYMDFSEAFELGEKPKQLSYL